MPRWVMLLALLAAPVLAQEDGVEEEEVPEEGVQEEEIKEEEIIGEDDASGEQWGLPAGRLSRGERDAPAVSVRVREGGALQVKAGDAWKDTTLNELGALLKSSAEEHDREMRKVGKSGYELPVKASRLFVSIDAEPTVPWQHIQYLMTVAAEQKYYKLELSDGTRRLLSFLPVDNGVVPREPPMVLKVAVHVVVRTERPGKWGDLDALRPDEVRYKIGNEETGDLRVVRDYVKKASWAIKDTPNAQIVGEIKAGHKVPFARVFDVMETFEAAGIPSVEFFGPAIPPPMKPNARLPYPSKDYDTND